MVNFRGTARQNYSIKIGLRTKNYELFWAMRKRMIKTAWVINWASYKACAYKKLMGVFQSVKKQFKALVVIIMLITLNGFSEEEHKKMVAQDISCNQQQYELIKKCSEMKDCSSWNKWREENPKEEVKLTGANLTGFYLAEINLNFADLQKSDLSKCNLKGAQLAAVNFCNAIIREAILDEAHLPNANLTKVDLSNSSLKNTGLCFVKMENAVACRADFTNADIQMGHLQNGSFIGTNFRFANLSKTDFSGANLLDSIFEDTVAHHCNLEKTDLTNAVFGNADFSHSKFWYAKFDIQAIHKAASLFKAKFLLAKMDDYLLLKDKDILFCYEPQYKLLLKCSDRKDLTEWNSWNPWLGYQNATKRIYLAGVTFDKMFLEKAHLWNADMRGSQFFSVTLKHAYLDGANLEGADMNYGPCFDEAFLDRVNLKNASLGPGKFRGTRLFEADLENTDLGLADFSRADLRRANLKNTKSIFAANFEKALMEAVHLEGANLYKCNFSGVDFHRGIVDSSTSMYQCQVNLETDFRCVALDSIGIDATTKRFLEYNIRRKNWNDWYWRTTYENDKKLYVKYDSMQQTYTVMFEKIIRFITTLPVRGFWWLSDYGTSAIRLLKCFAAIWAVFALLYFMFPSCITNLEYSKGISSTDQSKTQLLKRSAYFSAFTMTTLGFGDMYPAPHTKGQFLVLMQVIIAYFLLGALITYLGVLFTSGGPFLIYSYPHTGIP